MLTVSEPDSSLSLKGHPTTIHPQIPWIQQLGTAKDDRAYSGDLFISELTREADGLILADELRFGL